MRSSWTTWVCRGTTTPALGHRLLRGHNQRDIGLPKASWTQPPRQSFMQPRRVVRSGSSPEMVAALLERTVIEEVNDAELQSISDDEDILEVASGTTDDDDDPHLETNLGEEFLSRGRRRAGTPAG